MSLVIYIFALILISQIFYRFKYYQAKFLAFLFLCLISFLISYLFPFRYVFYTIFAFFTFLSVFIIFRRKRIDVDGKSELVFLASFCYFLFLRFLIPDIFGAEKLMDIAFLNSVLKASSFPPPDPFLAGHTLNFYYYFGYVIGAAITLMSFVEPEVGFNIAIASVSSFSVMLVFGFLRDVLKSEKGALIGSIFVLFSGNLYAACEFFKNALTLKIPDFLFYWNPTRVIEGTINEFPYFSFIHADFHAHVVAIPIKLLFIALLYDYYRGEKIKGLTIIPVVFILFVTNSWDAPLSIFLIGIVILVRWANITKIDTRFRKGEFALDIFIILASAFSIALFTTTMDLEAAKISFPKEKTFLAQFLMFFSIQLVFAYFYFKDEAKSPFTFIALFLGLIASIFIPIAIVIVPLMLISAKKALKGDFPAILVFSATFLMLTPEIVSVDTRLNTVFKFYLAAWLLLTIPGTIVLHKAIKHPSRLNLLLLCLFALSLVYPVIATPLRYYKAELTLNGMEFVKGWNEGDYEAIKWLKSRNGTIVEEALKCYEYGGRFAAFTGNPTIIAWPGHEVQWRDSGEMLSRRMGEVRTIYTSENCTQVLYLLNKYNVSYVIVGYQEKRVYNASKEKFERCGLKEVFSYKNTYILSR